MDCPDCQAHLTEHLSTFDGRLFECPTHGLFAVSNSAQAVWTLLDASGQASALERARIFAAGETPMVTSHDL